MPDIKALKTTYTEEIIPKLKKDLEIDNTHSVPKLVKVTINAGIGSFMKNHGKDPEAIIKNLTVISGQKPVLNKAKKSISNFKIREGDVIGASVTLRGERMYHFISKLVNIVFPRVRDFRGISHRSFDGNGNYSIGFKEHIVFPEISPDDVIKIHGLQVNISTTAETDEDGFALLKELGFPFIKQNK